jgi:uncharacterized membrane protein (GlpM family)
MPQYIIKTLVTLVTIITVSEISKRSTLIGGILVSLPIISIMAMIWLWVETKDKARVAQLSTSVFWLVIPSLALFITLPIFLKRMSFGYAMLLASAVTIVAYYLMISILGHFNIRL